MSFKLQFPEKLHSHSLPIIATLLRLWSTSVSFHLTLFVLGLQDTGDLYSLAVLYSDFSAFLQLVAIFEPSVGKDRAPCGLTLNCELASLVHYYWIPHRF